MAENSNNNDLNPPPPQTVRGIIIYHENYELDDRIRKVRILQEGGWDIDTICEVLDRKRSSIYNYLRQIDLAQQAYMQAFPGDFDSGIDGLHHAILDRKGLDTLLRQELTRLQGDTNPSNKVGIYKLIMRNLRESEELRGLLVQHIEHSGEVSIKDQVKELLDQAPAEVREAYLDALSAVIAAAEAHGAAQFPEPE